MTIVIAGRPWNGTFRIVGADWFEARAKLLGFTATELHRVRDAARQFVSDTSMTNASWDQLALLEHEAALRVLETFERHGIRDRSRVELLAATLSQDHRTRQHAYDWFHVVAVLARDPQSHETATPAPPREVRELVQRAKRALGPSFADSLWEEPDPEPTSDWDRAHAVVWEPQYETTVAEVWTSATIPVVVGVLLSDNSKLLTTSTVEYLRRRLARPDATLISWELLQEDYSPRIEHE